MALSGLLASSTLCEMHGEGMTLNIRNRLVLAVAISASLAACSVRPDGSNGQRRDFDVAGVSYQQAYHRADSYLRQCARGFVGLSPNVTTGNIYAETNSAELQTMNGSGVIVVRAAMTGTPQGSRVTLVTIRKALQWNSKDLDAIEAAVRTGAIVCR